MGCKRNHGQQWIKDGQNNYSGQQEKPSRLRVKHNKAEEAGKAGDVVVYIARVFRHRGRSRGGDEARRDEGTAAGAFR